MTRPPFLLPVADLVADAGSRRAVEIDTPIQWGFEMATVGPKIRADLMLENASGVLVVRGDVVTSAKLICHRCLSEWTEEVNIALTEVIGFDGEDDGYVLDRDVADLEPVLRDAVLLEVPLLPQCREECLGLCATCGADLNTGECPGHDEEVDSPFSELRDLLEP